MKQIPDFKFGVYDSFYASLQSYMDELAAAAPQLVRKSEIGRSREDRSLSLLTITDYSVGVPENKPALLIFANMHCHELSGPIASLRTARGLLEEQPELLKNNTFYIIPRINPDGAEKVLEQSGFIRSRWAYSHRVNTMHHEDMDGNGIIAEMRKECPWGNKCLDPNDPTRLIDRTADSKGPFYFYYGEGVIEKWDGVLLPPEEVEGDLRDWNRCWPKGWSTSAPNMCDFPCSEPEMYHLATFIAEHKNIFGTINYHNGWGLILSCKGVESNDRKFMSQLLGRASELTGYPASFDGTANFGEFRSSDAEFHGQFDDHAYQNYGLAALTIELGTIENSAGIKSEEVYSIEYSSDFNSRPQVASYQKDHPEQRKALQEWKTIDHPQLGKVEVGGYDCVGIASPAPAELKKVCDAVYQFTCEFAKKKPFLKVVHEEKTQIGSDVVRLRLIVQNAGDLPTYVMTPGQKSAWRKTPYAELNLSNGVECLSRQRGIRLPHFNPWESRVLEFFLRYNPAKKDKSVTLCIDGGAAGSQQYTISLTK